MTKILYQTHWISLLENDHGNAYIEMGDAVLIIPIASDGEVLFINEYSVAYDEIELLLPTGAIETNEDPILAANRELQEEIGYKANHLDFLGTLRPNSKYTKLKFFVYLARDLTPSKLDGDDEWEITVEKAPFGMFEELITAGRLQDATVIAALYLAKRFLEK